MGATTQWLDPRCLPLGRVMCIDSGISLLVFEVHLTGSKLSLQKIKLKWKAVSFWIPPFSTNLKAFSLQFSAYIPFHKHSFQAAELAPPPVKPDFWLAEKMVMWPSVMAAINHSWHWWQQLWPIRGSLGIGGLPSLAKAGSAYSLCVLEVSFAVLLLSK